MSNTSERYDRELLSLRSKVVYICRDCGAMVDSKFTHDAWHASLDSKVKDLRGAAGWQGPR